MPGYASRLINNEDRYADPDYRVRLREFMQEINPKPEHVIAAMAEIQQSKKQDLVVYATDPSGVILAHATVWASSMKDALSRAGDALPDDLPLYSEIAVCSKEVFAVVQIQAESWRKSTSWQQKHN